MFEGGIDVLPRFGAGENPGSRILRILELVQGFARDPEQDSIAIVEKCLVEGLQMESVNVGRKCF